MEGYSVEGVLGRGAFARVYRVRRKADGRLYALKAVNVLALTSRELRDALTEVRLIASLRHVNVVAYCHSFMEGSKRLCIVMEFCGGGDLARVIQQSRRARRRIRERRILDWAYQIAQGLEYLHGHGVLHRDLKPGNCFLSNGASPGGGGLLKLGDFNVSTVLRGGALASTQIGTPYYMSPEVWRQRPYDSKCDIWSFGVVLYELACLRPPFDGSSMPDLKRAVLRGRFRPLSSVFSPSLGALIREMLHVLPGNRPTPRGILSHALFAGLDRGSEASGGKPPLPSVSSADSHVEGETEASFLEILSPPSGRARLDAESIAQQLPEARFREGPLPSLLPSLPPPPREKAKPMAVHGSLAAIHAIEAVYGHRPAPPAVPRAPRSRPHRGRGRLPSV